MNSGMTLVRALDENGPMVQGVATCSEYPIDTECW